MKLLNRRRERRVANAVIADPEEHTGIDPRGAVRSIQAADVDLPERELDAIWSPMHLERLARTYWRYLSRVTLGLVRVAYSDTERAVVLISRPFVLLRFHPPDYEMSAVRGIVRWRIRDGLLVARRDEGHLEIDVRRVPGDRPGHARVHVEVEVANFYPRLAHSIAVWFYRATQSRVHVLVTHGFLRHLARLELEESAVGRFASVGPAPVPGASGNGAALAPPPEGGEEVTVGETPWKAVAAIAATALVVAIVAALAWRSRD